MGRGVFLKTVAYACLALAVFHSLFGVYEWQTEDKDPHIQPQQPVKYVITSKLANEVAATTNIAAVPTTKTTNNKIETTASTFRERKLDSGWDQAGLNYYNDQKQKLQQSAVLQTHLGGRNESTTVSALTIGNAHFWSRVNSTRPSWERNTFHIFAKYVTADTIVVDFGCWIGPTLLYHGQFSKHSFGIEADPVAFATAEFNVAQNANPRVTVESACVSAPHHVGSMTMRGAKAPGASMSGITDKLARKKAGSWQVACYTLPSILDTWGVVLSNQPVMFKMDVESYECELLPSLYDWLKDEPRLPTMYITFHPEINDCTAEQWAGILKVFQLYAHVGAKGGLAPLALTSTTTLAEFQEMKLQAQWRRDSTFVVSGNRVTKYKD